MVKYSPIAREILVLLYECGLVSRRLVLCLPYSYRNISVQSKRLVDSGWIKEYGVGKVKRYRLLAPSAQYLHRQDSARFTGYDTREHRVRMTERAMTVGDAAALLRFAGYGVYREDKPPLPAHTPLTVNAGTFGKALYNNKVAHSYGGGYEKHTTPVNCFYTAYETKRFEDTLGDSETTTKDIRYSRSVGALFTPDTIFRLYHARDVALEFRQQGEDNYTAQLAKLFTGHIPSQSPGTLVFGYDFGTADKIIRQSLDPELIRLARIRGGVLVRMNASNLSSDLLFFPLCRESILPLRFMSYPYWSDWLGQYIRQRIYPDMTHYKTGFFLGEQDGYKLFNGLSPNLTRLITILRNLGGHQVGSLEVLCFDWQQDFYKEQLDRYGRDSTRYRFRILSEQDFAVIEETHRTFWRGDAHS